MRRLRARCATLGPSPLGHKVPVGGNLAEVGGHEEESDEEALGGDAAHPPASGLTERLMRGIFHITIGALDGVAVGGVDTGPLPDPRRGPGGAGPRCQGR